jgi:hypothetical protein
LFVVLPHGLRSKPIVGDELVPLLDPLRHLELAHPLRTFGQSGCRARIGRTYLPTSRLEIVLQFTRLAGDRRAILLQLAHGIGTSRFASRRK